MHGWHTAGLIGAVALLFASPAAQAQPYPNKPIRFLVPSPPASFIAFMKAERARIAMSASRPAFPSTYFNHYLFLNNNFR